MKILLTGYTYTRNNLFEVFESYPEKDNLYFILPNNWREKRGKIKYEPAKKEGFKIWYSRAFFFHSHYPLIGGLFKGWMPFFIFRFIKLRFLGGVDILYTNGEANLLSTLYNAIWAKILGVKHMFNFWENIPYEQKDKGLKLKLKRLIIKTNIYLSNGALCGMHKAEEILKGFNPPKDFVIGTFLHAGFNENRFQPGLEPKLRNKLGLQNKFVLLFVGALGYRKGIHIALESLSLLKNKYNNLHFVIVGSGEYEKNLKLKVENLKLDNLVTFIPWMANEDLPSVFCSADVFLYPSIPYEGWEEQFGYSIAEASLCGLPVITTNTGSISEVLIDNKTGIMVPPNNPIALSKAISKLMSDSNYSRQIGENGRNYIKNNYSNKIIALKLFGLFNQIFKENNDRF